jgi:hypothetical protein
MDLRDKNDRKRLAAWTSVQARGGFEAVLSLKSTAGTGNSGHLSPPFPRKPDGLLRKGQKQLISEFPRVKTPSVDEFRS